MNAPSSSGLGLMQRATAALLSLRLRTQLALVVALAGGVPLAVSGVTAHQASEQALTDAAMSRVEAIRAARQFQIEEAFRTVAAQAAALAEDTMVVDGAVALTSSFHQLANSVSAQEKAAATSALNAFYARDVAPRLQKNGVTIDIARHIPVNDDSLVAQARYIADNPQPLGKKHLLDRAGTTAYDDVHARLHPLLRAYLERFGYYDLFIIDPRTDVVVYTVFKETDFGKHLDTQATNDGLVRAYRQALRAPKDQTSFEDFAPYEPSYNDAAAFVSVPVYRDGAVIAVLALQLPVDRINAIVNEPVGLGETGRAFLVGADHRMRTQDRHTSERTIFVRRVDNDAVTAATAGGTGVGRYQSIADTVVGSWSPVRIPGLSWSIVVEIDDHEALASVRAMSRLLWLLLLASVLLLVAIGVSFSARLARRIGRAVHTAEAVARGDFSSEIVVDSRDEIGDLQVALQHMRTDLLRQMTAIETQAASLQLLLDSTGDALLPVSREGVVQAGLSTIAKAWFGEVNANTKVWDYLYRGDTDHGLAFELAFQQMAEDFLPFELLADQMPSRLVVDSRAFKLEFKRIGGEQLDAVLIIVRDVTALLQAQEREADFRQVHQAMQVMTRDRDGFRKGLFEIDRLLADLEAHWTDDLVNRRTLHTVKGSAAVLGFSGVAEACHAIEDQLVDEASTVTAASFTTVRDIWRRVLGQLEAFLGEDTAIRIDESDYDKLVRQLRARADHDELLAMVRSFRDEPTRAPLNRLGAQATRVAHQLGKPVTVAIVDNGLRLPSNACDAVWLSAVHIVRNAVDHGLESAEARAAAGKPAEGTLTLSTRIVDDQLVIAFVDDGGGIDWERVRMKAGERGLPASTHSDLVDALFSDGLSTRDEVSALSGRGVGLSAVKAAVEALDGALHVDSTRGVGTTIELRLPLPRVVSQERAAAA